MLAAGFAGALLLAACGAEEPEEPAPGTEIETPETEEPEDTEPIEEPEAPEGDDPETPTEEPEAPEDTGEEAPDEATEEPDPDGDVEALEGEAVTEASDEGEFGEVVAITDVRIASHAGFDRIVFEIEGDGTAGWDIRYVDEPTSQGSGEPVELEGEAALSIALQNVTLPPEVPEGIELFEDDRATGAEGGLVHEVVNDTIFEGIQSFFAGLDAEQPFLVERFEDPQRVVIDIPHDG